MRLNQSMSSAYDAVIAKHGATMITFCKCAVALSLMLTLLGHAKAESNEASESKANGEPGVVVKVERAIERGAKVAASGVERGVRAAASGVEQGAKAAASGVEHGAKAAAHGVEKGAKATAHAASHVANKIGGESASSPSSEK